MPTYHYTVLTPESEEQLHDQPTDVLIHMKSNSMASADVPLRSTTCEQETAHPHHGNVASYIILRKLLFSSLMMNLV